MIDSTLFMADIPAGTYAIGDIIPLTVKSGPGSVRDGYGSAILKGIYSGSMSAPAGFKFEVVVQNSNFIDPIINGPNELNNTLGIDKNATGYQTGHDAPLAINSTWNVYAKVVTGATTTSATSVYALIEIDYPSVGSVANPISETGVPMSVEVNKTINIGSTGSAVSKAWDIFNVDQFKPGFRYLLEKVGLTFQNTGTGVGGYGFVAFANAAGQNGLTRIIPVSGNVSALSEEVTYSSVLTKGPMDVMFLLFGTTAGPDTVNLVCDYVRR